MIAKNQVLYHHCHAPGTVIMMQTLTKQDIHCPDCGRPCVSRARRNRLDYVLSFLFIRPFLCLACGARFRRFSFERR
jgi:hypothetical protein